MSLIEPESRYTISSSQIVWQCFDDELIVIHLGSGVYYSLNRPAATIWCWMQAGFTPVQTALDATGEILRFWQELLDAGLIAPLSGDAPVTPADSEPPRPGALSGAPALASYKDMQDLFLLDPIHDVSEAGWPSYRPE